MEINSYSFPIKPETFGVDYVFPEDLTKLTLEALGQLMSRIAAYRGYTLSLLARFEPKKKIGEQVHRLKFIEKTREFDDGGVQKRAKEKAEIDREVVALSTIVYDNEAKSEFLSTLVTMYTGHIEVISREISRRQFASNMRGE
jgi:hypothetical protein